MCRRLKPSCCVCVCRLGLARQRTSATAVTSSALPDEPEHDGSSPANHLVWVRGLSSCSRRVHAVGHLCAAEPPAAVRMPESENGAHCRRCSRRSDSCSRSSSCGCSAFAELPDQLRKCMEKQNLGAIRRFEGRSLRPWPPLRVLHVRMYCLYERRANGPYLH